MSYELLAQYKPWMSPPPRLSGDVGPEVLIVVLVIYAVLFVLLLGPGVAQKFERQPKVTSEPKAETIDLESAERRGYERARRRA